MAGQTKQERLQTAWELTGELMEATVEYIPFNGWYVVPHHARWLGDEGGDYIGANFAQADRYISEFNEKLIAMRPATKAAS